MADQSTDWQESVIRLKAEDPSRTSAAIAEIVGKHAGTVRKVLNRNAEEIERVGKLNGLGDLITGTFTARVVDVLGAERFQRASEEYRIQPQGHVALITEITVKPVGD
jgi:hypothetical protein